MDFSTVLSGLSSTEAILAIIGAGSVVASVGSVVWAVHKIGSFFDSESGDFDSEEEIHAALRADGWTDEEIETGTRFRE